MKKILPALFILIFTVTGMISCMRDKETQEGKDQPVKTAQDIYSYVTELPDAPGVELFNANCATCHSLRYIEMQPAFPEKTWQKIVDKMIKSFGAPIPDSSAQQIVKYLVRIKGTPTGELAKK